MTTKARQNVADRLQEIARNMPDAIAIATPNGSRRSGKRAYDTTTFAELDDDASRIARGLVEIGVAPGDRLALLVPPSIDFVAIVFGLLRSGAVGVFVDRGMGTRRMVRCLAAVEPDGFMAVPRGQAVRALLRRRFPAAHHNVTVGHRWCWRGKTLRLLRRLGGQSRVELPTTTADDPAAIIFTSGSTGPAKGVLYRHETFTTQVSEIQRRYGIRTGAVDLACFALFGLFNSAMGVTTVFPNIDFSRPAAADPTKVIQAANDWQVTQAFASPAIWETLSRHCARTGERVGSLARIFSCGAPVAADLVRRTLQLAHPRAEFHTPFGATEALPVASIEAKEILGETTARTEAGAGVCVGKKFATIDWKVIQITDEPIETLADAAPLSDGEIGELLVAGPQVTREYVTHPIANRESKVTDGDKIWHRMGDVGYFDDEGRFWYCGRKSHRVLCETGTVFSIPCEAIFNSHPRVKRSAVVAIGRPPDTKAAIVLELERNDRTKVGQPPDAELVADLRALKARHRRVAAIEHVFLQNRFPLDPRHNAKIDRIDLAKKIARRCRRPSVERDALLLTSDLLQT